MKKSTKWFIGVIAIVKIKIVRITNSTIKILQKIAKALEVQVDDLIN